MQLLLDHHRQALLANGRRSAAGEDIDPFPVVKLFTPDAGATWLLTDLDPEDPDIGFGLCDLGLGHPELGTVRLGEIEALRGRLRLPVERNTAFRASGPLSAYVIAARRYQSIVTDPSLIAAANAGNRCGACNRCNGGEQDP